MENMDRLKPYKIDLHGLKEGVNTLGFRLDDEYFSAVEAEDVRQGCLDAVVEIVRKASLFEVNFNIKGTVLVPCDLCLDDMEQPVKAESRLVVKFGKENSEDDDLVIVDENEGILDVSWFMYESIVLNLSLIHI